MLCNTILRECYVNCSSICIEAVLHKVSIMINILTFVVIFQRVFGVSSLQQGGPDHYRKLAAAVYLQVSTISQALIFVTRARSWSFVERPGFLLVVAFLVAQLVSGSLIFFFYGIANAFK